MPEITIKQSLNAVEFSITLPWETVIALHELLRPVIDELGQSDQVRSKQDDWEQELAIRAENQRIELAEIRRRNLALGRTMERIVRRYVRDAKASGSDQKTTKLRLEGIRFAITQVCDHFGNRPSFGTASFFISEYRKQFEAKRVKRRDRELWRLYQQGFSNDEIAKHFKFSPHYASNLLSKVRKAQKEGKA